MYCVIYCVFVVLFVFFFKQKTAYEMRISDWSSDVCSSDLLTPNVTSILGPARAAKKGGADAVSLINTVNSIMSVDLDALAPTPTVGGKGTHGGYCGPAVKPIALHMVAEIRSEERRVGRECVRTCRSRGSPYHSKKKHKKH